MGLNHSRAAARKEDQIRPEWAKMEHRVAIAGDWHSNRIAMRAALRLLHEDAPDVETILHLGDFNMGSGRPWADYQKSLAGAMRDYGIRRILVTPGNHDDWGHLAKQFALHPGTPYCLPGLRAVSFLPRGHAFSIGDRRFVAFGGAASPDQETRVAGKDWWPEEEPTRRDMTRAVEAGPADILLSHETINGGTTSVDTILARPQRHVFTQAGLDASSRSREVVTELWEALRPQLMFHGHMHVRAERRHEDGRRVYSLAAGGSAGNVGVLDLRNFSWSWLD